MPPVAIAPAAPRAIVETPMMREVRLRMLGTRSLEGRFVTLVGPAGVGKTTTAKWIEATENEKADNAEPDSFRVARMTLNTVQVGTGNVEKQVLTAVHSAVVAPLTASASRGLTAQALAHNIVQYCQTTNTQLLILDEAGRLCPEALEALTLVLQLAGDGSVPHSLTIALVGMGALPQLIKRIPQVRTRTAATIYFRPYTASDAYRLLSRVHPFFAQLNLDTKEGQDVLTWVHRKSHGLPRLMMRIVDAADTVLTNQNQPFSLVALKAALSLDQEDQRRQDEDMESGYATSPMLSQPDPEEEEVTEERESTRRRSPRKGRRAGGSRS